MSSKIRKRNESFRSFERQNKQYSIITKELRRLGIKVCPRSTMGEKGGECNNEFGTFEGDKYCSVVSYFRSYGDSDLYVTFYF